MASKIVWTSDCGKYRIVAVDVADLDKSDPEGGYLAPHPVTVNETGLAYEFPRVLGKVLVPEMRFGADAMGVPQWSPRPDHMVNAMSVALAKRLL